jgi:uncharacterized protein YsxB (DUF464 family)
MIEQEKMIEPTIENLDLLNDLGFTYKEIGNCFEPYISESKIRYLFTKYKLKKKTKSDVISEYLDIHPFAKSKDIAKEFDISVRLVDQVKASRKPKTVAVINFDKNTCDFKCTISGHSGYAHSGYDIVCAAISSISIFMVNTLYTFGIDCKAKTKDGYLSFECEANEEYVYMLLESFIQHLQELEKQYPNNIQVIYNV